VTLYSLPNGNDKLLIYFENPWSGYGWQGACIFKNKAFNNFDDAWGWSRGQYKYLESNGWPSNCILLDNSKTKKDEWSAQTTKLIEGYTLKVTGKYGSGFWGGA